MWAFFRAIVEFFGFVRKDVRDAQAEARAENQREIQGARDRLNRELEEAERKRGQK